MTGKNDDTDALKEIWLKHQQACDQLWSKLLNEIDPGDGAMPRLIELRRRFDELTNQEDLNDLFEEEFKLMLALTKLALYELHVQEAGILAFQDQSETEEREDKDYE